MGPRSWVRELVGDGFSDDATLSRAPGGRYYTSPELHELELGKVFSREWGYICHVSEVADVGSYVVGEVAGESVYVIRDADAKVSAFYNVCQHRGHQLLEGRGRVANVVVCPYHAWSYGHDGRLRGAPKMRQVREFCKDDTGLAAVRVEVVAGFVFVNLDDGARSLGEVAQRFEPIVRSMVADPEALRLVERCDYDIAANWKIVVENFLEAYHVESSGPAHRALATVIDTDTDTYGFRLDGHTIEYTAKGGAAETLPYEANPVDDFADSAGPPFHQVFLFPNMTFSVFPGTNMLFVFEMAPDGPDRCAERIHYFALDPQMSEPSQSAEQYVSRRLNVEDIGIVEAVGRGVRSRGYRPGRLMVDAEAEAGWGEQFVHHFNMLNLAALERPT